jgi:hypothetical protein
VSKDPIGFASGMNWYAYVEGMPPVVIDPNRKSLEEMHMGIQASRMPVGTNRPMTSVEINHVNFLLIGLSAHGARNNESNRLRQRLNRCAIVVDEALRGTNNGVHLSSKQTQMIKNLLRCALIVVSLIANAVEDVDFAIKLVRDDLYKNALGKLVFKLPRTPETQSGSGELIATALSVHQGVPNTRVDLSDLVDETSWEVVTSGQYYRDKSRIYELLTDHEGSRILMLDFSPDQFKVAHRGTWMSVADLPILDWNIQKACRYTLRRGVVHFDGFPLKGADPRTFQVIEDVEGCVAELFAKDRKHMYHESRIISREDYLAKALAHAIAAESTARRYGKAMASFIGGIDVK